MSPRPDVSEERKQQIIDAAITAFARNGFHKTRMDDIAEESKISKGLLYWYFKSKEEITIAILDTLIGFELRNFKDLPSMDRTARERLELFMNHFIDDLSQMDRIRPILYEFYSLAMREKGLQKYVAQVLQAYLDILIPIFQQGIERGEFLSIDPEKAALAAGAILEGTVLMWVFDPTRVKLKEQVETGIQLLLRGLEA